MYTSEKQFNTTTSDLAIEEVYTNLDVEPNDPCISTKGFAFRYPQRWLNDPTHTQCVLHIIRLRLIIFHTPKNFHGRNKIE